MTFQLNALDYALIAAWALIILDGAYGLFINRNVPDCECPECR